MKDGWWRRTRSGGSGGGGGRGCQLDEMGSKAKKWIESGDEEEDKRAYKERKGGKEGE